MRPRKQIVLISKNEWVISLNRLVLETRMDLKVNGAKDYKEANSIMEDLAALDTDTFAILIDGPCCTEAYDLDGYLLVPTVVFGAVPEYAVGIGTYTVLNGKGFSTRLLEAVKLACVRKRGPKKGSTWKTAEVDPTDNGTQVYSGMGQSA